MAKFRTTVSVILFGVCAAAGAQTPGMGDTREVSPEKKAPPAPEHGKSQMESGGHELKRCDDYSGTRREDCLRGLRAAEGAAAAGDTQRPEPPTAPPPNNPR